MWVRPLFSSSPFSFPSSPLMNSLACTGCLQLHLGTLLNCFSPTNITFFQLLHAPWSASSLAWFGPAPNLLILFTDKNSDLPSVFWLVVFWTSSILIFGYVVHGHIAGKLLCRNYLELMVYFHLSIRIFNRISYRNSPLQILWFFWFFFQNLMYSSTSKARGEFKGLSSCELNAKCYRDAYNLNPAIVQFLFGL